MDCSNFFFIRALLCQTFRAPVGTLSSCDWKLFYCCWMERTWKLNVRHNCEMTIFFLKMDEHGWLPSSIFPSSKFLPTRKLRRSASFEPKTASGNLWSKRVTRRVRLQSGNPNPTHHLALKIEIVNPHRNIIPSDFFEAWLLRFVSQLEPGSCNHNFNASSGTKPGESETSPSLHHGPPNQPWPPDSTVAVQLQLRPLKKGIKKLQTRNFHEIS